MLDRYVLRALPLAVALLLASVCPSLALAQDKPNIILMMADDMGAGDAPSAMDDEGGAVASKEEQEADSMAVYESFIIGMLTNFDSLSLERIQNMLKMFVVDPTYDKTQAELSKFLQKLVTEEKVAYEGGSYRKK